MLLGLPDPHPDDSLPAGLEQALRRARFVPPASAWMRVREAVVQDASRPGRALGLLGVILLCLLILAALIYLFNRVLAELLTGPV